MALNLTVFGKTSSGTEVKAQVRLQIGGEDGWRLEETSHRHLLFVLAREFDGLTAVTPDGRVTVRRAVVEQTGTTVLFDTEEDQ